MPPPLSYIILTPNAQLSFGLDTFILLWYTVDMDKIICGDCLDVMRGMDADSVDLVVTSPPYDNLRLYHGYTLDVPAICVEFMRIMKPGGVIVWVVGDATIDGSETGTSFRQALTFMDAGFNLHDTMIYKKPGVGACGSNLAYWQAFEYMFLFTQGKPRVVNRIKDRVNTTAGSKRDRSPKSELLKSRMGRPIIIGTLGIRDNVWEYSVGAFSGSDSTSHPAPFPEKLAADHIVSWSNAGDLVFDPMCGSGTTLKMAEHLNRRWLGCDVSEEYCEIARERIRAERSQLKMF